MYVQKRFIRLELFFINRQQERNFNFPSHFPPHHTLSHAIEFLLCNECRCNCSLIGATSSIIHSFSIKSLACGGYTLLAHGEYRCDYGSCTTPGITESRHFTSTTSLQEGGEIGEVCQAPSGWKNWVWRVPTLLIHGDCTNT